jgi:hypothetical protein
MRAIVDGGVGYSKLIVELLRRAPVLDMSLPDLNVHISQHSEGFLHRPRESRTAHQLFLSLHHKWQGTGASLVTVSVAFDAAIARDRERRSLAAPILVALLPLPVELADITAAYASLAPAPRHPNLTDTLA